jgi:N-acetylmuramoyl-L-alanine amidase
MNKRGYIAIAVIVLLAAAAVAYFGFLRPSAGDKSAASTSKGKVIVALDAGHGGVDPGATSGDFNEKVVNLAVMQKVAALFASDKQIRVVTTRTVDVKVPNDERIRIAESAGASLYVSLHVNSFPQSDIYGIETYVDSTRKESDPSWTLAAMLEGAVTGATGGRNRGIRTQELYLDNTTMPAVTVEMGYITNASERALLFDSAYQDKLAAGIASGIRQFVAWQAAIPTTTPASTSTTKTTPTTSSTTKTTSTTPASSTTKKP